MCFGRYPAKAWSGFPLYLFCLYCYGYFYRAEAALSYQVFGIFINTKKDAIAIPSAGISAKIYVNQILGLVCTKPYHATHHKTVLNTVA